MPPQFPISSPCPFERNNGVGCDSFLLWMHPIKKKLRVKKIINDLLKRFHEYL
jgi:hypothetical protein